MKYIAAFIFAFFLFAAPAKAEDAYVPPSAPIVVTVPKASSVVSISPAFAEWLQPYIDAAVNALILAIVGWLCTWLHTHFNVTLDQKLRDGLTKALQNQAGSLIADGAVKVLDNGKLDVHNGALAIAAREVMAVVPDAAKRFGLTPDFIASRIVDAIPQIAAGAQIIAKGAAGPKPS